MEINAVCVTLSYGLFSAIGFEVALSGELNDGSLFWIRFDGEHMFLDLIFFRSVEIECAEGPDGFVNSFLAHLFSLTLLK